MPDREGRYPIHYAAAGEVSPDDLVRMLREGADPNIADRAGFTPLHFAALNLDPTSTRLLLEAGAQVETRNKFGATPLLVALSNAREDDHGVVGLLLAAGADIDAANNAGVSPRSFVEAVANYDLDKFLYPTRPSRNRAQSVRSARGLMRVGQFRELEHGHPDGPSLLDSIREEPHPQEAELIAYLRSGTRLVESGKRVADVISGDQSIGDLTLMTDGVWEWYSDLPYYVERYHVALSPGFVQEAARRRFRRSRLSRDELARLRAEPT